MPDTRKICEAYGLPYVRCENRGELPQRLREVLDAEGPVVCEVMAQVDQRILPVAPSRLLPDGSMRSKALHEMLPDLPTSPWLPGAGLRIRSPSFGPVTGFAGAIRRCAGCRPPTEPRRAVRVPLRGSWPARSVAREPRARPASRYGSPRPAR